MGSAVELKNIVRDRIIVYAIEYSDDIETLISRLYQVDSINNLASAIREGKIQRKDCVRFLRSLVDSALKKRRRFKYIGAAMALLVAIQKSGEINKYQNMFAKFQSMNSPEMAEASDVAKYLG